MSRGSRKARAPKVLVFGENENDTRMIAELLQALCPEMSGRVKVFRRPPILIRDASPRDVPDRVSKISALIDAEATDSDILCVFAHEDCDAVEPAHESIALKIEEAFAREGYHVHAVAPAWESEAWLFLWPDAVRSHVGKWRSLDGYKGRDVGKIVDAKETLTRALRPVGKGGSSVRDYRESDGPEIARRVRELGVADSPEGRSGSYDRFRASVSACCATMPAR